MQGPEPVLPAQQKRSQKTLTRILDATEKLLFDKPFEAITVAEIAAEAGISVGAMYNRCRDKEALLAAVYNRHQEAIKPFLAKRLSALEQLTLKEAIETVVREAVQLHRSNRGLYRALVMHGHRHPDPRYRIKEERSKFLVARFSRLIESRADECGHADPRLAGALAGVTLLAVLREKILFGDSTASALKVDDDGLAREVSMMLCSYLGLASRKGKEGIETCD